MLHEQLMAAWAELDAAGKDKPVLPHLALQLLLIMIQNGKIGVSFTKCKHMRKRKLHVCIRKKTRKLCPSETNQSVNHIFSVA